MPYSSEARPIFPGEANLHQLLQIIGMRDL